MLYDVEFYGDYFVYIEVDGLIMVLSFVVWMGWGG